jgi:hypothetical protein
MIRLASLLLFWSASVFAAGGDVGGNGGGLVVCEQSAGTFSYELLDYFEAEEASPPLPYDLGPAEWDAFKKVELALSRLSLLDPKRASAYRAQAQRFLSEVEWKTKLQHIPDAGETVIPSHCHIEQGAIRRPKLDPTMRPYLIDPLLWKALDEDHRAGLVLHELIWGEMRDLGQKSSEKARRFNAIVSSSALQSMKADEYETLTKELYRPAIAFRADKFDVNALANQPFSLDLPSLLLYQVPGSLLWQFVGPVPAWMGIVGSSIIGVPRKADPKPITVSLVVTDGETSAIAQLRILVK